MIPEHDLLPFANGVLVGIMLCLLFAAVYGDRK